MPSDAECSSDVEYEDEDSLPFASEDLNKSTNTIPTNKDELRVLHTLATDAACAFLTFIIHMAKIHRESQRAIERAALYDQQLKNIKLCHRKFMCDLEWIDPVKLKEYCNTWNLTWSPSTSVHCRDRRVGLQQIMTWSNKWWNKENDSEGVDERHNYVHIFKDTTGTAFQVVNPMPSVYCTQMLTAHIQLYNIQRTAGDFYPQFGCYAYQEFFHERTDIKREAAELLRVLTLLAKMHNVIMSNSSQAFVGLILRALLACNPVTTDDVAKELRKSELAAGAIGCDKPKKRRRGSS